jgi:hypothetical protein
MRLTLDMPGNIRVVNTTDHKGNPLSVLMVDDMEILFAEGEEPDGVTCDVWEDLFRHHLNKLLGKVLLESLRDEDKGIWSAESPTGHGTWGRDGTHHSVFLAPEED